MPIPLLDSVKSIERQYLTGEEPVLVMCSDRNANNANLLYDVEREELVSIDYGCIFNTATFEFPLSQLTSTDTILYSDLFQCLIQGKSPKSIEMVAKPLRAYYLACVDRCRQSYGQMVNDMPKDWKIPMEVVENKVKQLFETDWIEGVWRSFMDCLTENI